MARDFPDRISQESVLGLSSSALPRTEARGRSRLRIIGASRPGLPGQIPAPNVFNVANGAGAGYHSALCSFPSVDFKSRAGRTLRGRTECSAKDPEEPIRRRKKSGRRPACKAEKDREPGSAAGPSKPPESWGRAPSDFIVTYPAGFRENPGLAADLRSLRSYLPRAQKNQSTCALASRGPVNDPACRRQGPACGRCTTGSIQQPPKPGNRWDLKGPPDPQNGAAAKRRAIRPGHLRPGALGGSVIRHRRTTATPPMGRSYPARPFLVGGWIWPSCGPQVKGTASGVHSGIPKMDIPTSAPPLISAAWSFS